MSSLKVTARFVGLLAALYGSTAICGAPPPLPACVVPACYDLTAVGATATINGAIFTVPSVSIDATGSGVIDSFVRIQAQGTEQGYNTSDRPVQFGEMHTDTHTQDRLLSSINSVTVKGIEYLEFVLDTGEAGGSNTFISLEQLRFYVGADQATNTAAGDYDAATKQLGSLTPIYDMDAGVDTYIQLSDPYSGNGKLDLILLVPKSLFVGDDTQSVYLYSQFGRAAPLDTDSSFEEWATKIQGTFTPEPGAIALLLIGLAALGFTSLRRRMAPQPRAAIA